LTARLIEQHISICLQRPYDQRFDSQFTPLSLISMAPECSTNRERDHAALEGSGITRTISPTLTRWEGRFLT
jgi:hypothetical protein